VLAEQFFGHRVVEFQEKLILAGDFLQKVLSAEFHGGIELLFGESFEALDTEILPVGGPADWGFVAGNSALAPFDDPFEDAEVFAKSWPQEFTFGVFAEPIYVENSRKSFDVFPHIEPMAEVIAHVVATERKHRHWVAANGSDSAGGGGGGFGALGGSKENAVRPVKGLENQRHRIWPSATEDNCIDGDSIGVLPMRIDIWALVCRGGESRVRMGGES